MKASELRIGNFVNTIDNILMTVSRIEKEEYSGWNGDDFDIVCLEYGKKDSYFEGVFEPIPLTEEWLLKFGAKELNAKRGILKEFVLKTVRVEMSNSGNFNYKNSKLVLDSVHQLQNLYFALTGEELTIKN
jgi:hypothetical protein